MPSLNSRAALLTILSRWAVAGFDLAALLLEAAFFRVNLCTFKYFFSNFNKINWFNCNYYLYSLFVSFTLDYALNINSRYMNMVRVQFPDFNYFLDLGNRNFSSLTHGRVEVLSSVSESR
jgi:hypothetical protein